MARFQSFIDSFSNVANSPMLPMSPAPAHEPINHHSSSMPSFEMSVNALVAAAKKGDLEGLARLLDMGIDVNGFSIKVLSLL